MTCEYVVERAAANLPQSTQAPLFTVSGGLVLLTGLVGEITTAIQNQANSSSLFVNPNTGSDVALLSLGNIANLAAGLLFGATSTDESVILFPTDPIVVPTGTVDLSCPASSTGQVAWTLTYRPLSLGAKVVAA